jgi:hypothetical protein
MENAGKAKLIELIDSDEYKAKKDETENLMKAPDLLRKKKMELEETKSILRHPHTVGELFTALVPL